MNLVFLITLKLKYYEHGKKKMVGGWAISIRPTIAAIFVTLDAPTTFVYVIKHVATIQTEVDYNKLRVKIW